MNKAERPLTPQEAAALRTSEAQNPPEVPVRNLFADFQAHRDEWHNGGVSLNCLVCEEYSDKIRNEQKKLPNKKSI